MSQDRVKNLGGHYIYQKVYSNQYGQSVNFNGHTSQVDLEDTNTFNSQLAKDVFGAPTKFEGVQFHFHAGSEHTIDGKRHDLEMHTVHYPKEPENDFIAAAVGIMFSLSDYDAELSTAQQQVIDAFFEGLKWDDESGSVVSDMILYGDLMEMVDSNNRWSYKGSVTTPPCDTYVYWNVLQTIYPISKKHLDLFVNKQLAQGEEGKLPEFGNYREIQQVDEHNVILISDGSKDSQNVQVVEVN